MAIEDFVEFELRRGGEILVNIDLVEAIASSTDGSVTIFTTGTYHDVKGTYQEVVKRIKNHKTTTAINKASKYY